MDEEGSEVFTLEICEKCHNYIVFADNVCIGCYVPDLIDTELVYEDV
jgi:hypothetical protein